MRFWFRSPQSEPSQDVNAPLAQAERREAGYYATQDPYGSALDQFDEKFDWSAFEEAEAREGAKAGQPRRFWRFWASQGEGDRSTPDDGAMAGFGGDFEADCEDGIGDGLGDSLRGSLRDGPGNGTKDRPQDDGARAPHDFGPKRIRKWVWASRFIAAALLLVFLTIGWLFFTAPLSKSLEPIARPQITLLASDGTPIARSGASVEEPVKAADLPDHVIAPFLAIEDRRFYSHWGIDPRGIARAIWTGVGGGSTITQQLAKFTFLSPERTLSRKAREALIAVWMEAWLTKDQILERYLSNAYFGDNQYGLRAASLHYFYRQPENLLPRQAAMLAGLLKAPSRLAPSKNYDLAKERMELVVASMVDAGYLSPAKAAAMTPPAIDVRAKHSLPNGTYFADWALQIAAQQAGSSGYEKQTLTTTLDASLQRLANRVIARAGLGTAQVALVAMRPDGEVVAMVGGRDYASSPFNRVTQARRQPGSTFKLFTYAAALREGWHTDDVLANAPIEKGSYRPRNAGARYSDRVTLAEAFASSSNVATVRLFQQLGSAQVIEQARAMGITSRLAANDPSLALGTSSVTLLELTAAYAGIAGNAFPVEPHAFAREEEGFFEWLFNGQSSLSARAHEDMEQMLRRAINKGTGRAAMLRIPNYGKTGTSQNNRDALFVGYAGDLVVGVWVGNDDNAPLGKVTGGGLPARIWRDFMTGAIAAARAPAQPFDKAPLDKAPLDKTPLENQPLDDQPLEKAPDPEGPIKALDIDPVQLSENARIDIEEGAVRVSADINGVPLDIRLDEDGVAFLPVEDE